MCCQAAVERAFAEMKASGAPEKHAVEAALFIFRLHHPDVPADRAEAEVFRWTVGRSVH
ncbi:hypothetical protein [Indioceanicola profundi]|uniref:hypothetical protein n=1 Tax=Indioceanicola profundi TaxID=2220096 RepID=UPI0013C51E5A|nr:hypothetical protein [Indioceanicola profundi]